MSDNGSKISFHPDDESTWGFAPPDRAKEFALWFERREDRAWSIKERARKLVWGAGEELTEDELQARLHQAMEQIALLARVSATMWAERSPDEGDDAWKQALEGARQRCFGMRDYKNTVAGMKGLVSRTTTLREETRA